MTDILTNLNTGGSGINIQELSQSLTDAEINPRRDLVQERIDKAELQLSGYAQLRAQAEQVSEALSLVSTLSSYAISSDSSAVGVTVTDPDAVEQGNTVIDVDALATAQVLNFGGFTDADAALGEGALTVSFGSWSTDTPPVFTAGTDPSQTLELQADATLNDLAAALGSIEGISARVIDVGDGTYTLGVISDTGADNALSISVGAGSSTALQDFDISADPTPVQAQAAQNAQLSINGINVTRANNQIDDLVPGVSLDISAVTDTPANVNARPNTEGALEVMQGFVDILNATTRLVDTLTARGFAGDEEAGELAGDSIAERFITQFETALGRGFGGVNGGSGTFLSDLGVRTERDGSLTLDETTFTAALAADPDLLTPLLQDTVVADTATISGTPAGDDAGGIYSFERDATTGAATLNGAQVFGSEQTDGTWLYTVSSGPLRGISLSVAADTTTARIEYAPSMVSTLQGQIEDLIASDGALASRDAALNATLDEEAEALDALDRRAEDLEARYLSRFTQMEQIITQLNSTGEYLEELVDSFNSNDN